MHIPSDGTQKNQVNNIVAKSGKWITGIQTNSLSRTEVYVSFMTAVTKTITYSFPATSINEKEMNQITIPLYKVALPRMGILPTLPLPYRYASSRYQGIDMPYFPAEQLIKKLDDFLYNGNQLTQVGKSLKMCMEDIQLETGLVNNLFEYEYAKYGALTQRTWIRHLWQDCDKHNILLQGKYERPKLSRENDFCLMERLCMSNHFNKQQIQIINRCRLYMKVITMTDITDSSGGFVTESVYMGTLKDDRRSKYVWPNQVRPPPRQWTLWQDAIDLVWSGTGTRRVQPALGNWIEQTHQIFLWQYNRIEHTLYYSYTNSIRKYIPSMIRSRRQRIFGAYEIVDELPKDHAQHEYQ